MSGPILGGPASFNAFQIKRKAHAIGRKEDSLGEDKWNPFRHVWTKSHQRSHTWDAEAGRDGPIAAELDEAGTSPIEPTLFCPPPAGSVSGHSFHEELANNDMRFRKPDRVETPTSTHGEEKLKAQHGFLISVFPKEPFTVANQVQRTFLAAWINVLLVCVPAGITLNFVVGSSIPTFIVNFIALIPLYFMTDLAMDELDMRLGHVLSTFLNISTSNFFQLMSSIILLVHRQVTVLKLSLIGGILANVLLLLGVSILCGGIRRSQQFFNGLGAHTSSIMLSLTSTSLLIPTACLLMSQTSPENVIKQSRGVAIILIIIYGVYLCCTLKTHYIPFAEEAQKVPVTYNRNAVGSSAIRSAVVKPALMISIPGQDEKGGSNNEKLRNMLNEDPPDIEEEPGPQLHVLVALATFLICAVLLFLCTDYIVNSIGALTQGLGLSTTFVGLILFPIPNCDTLPITCAMSDEMDTTLNMTVVKSIQTALLVLPFTVLVGWGLGIEEATLVFDGFEVVSLFATIILLNLIIGKESFIWYVSLG